MPVWRLLRDSRWSCVYQEGGRKLGADSRQGRTFFYFSSLDSNWCLTFDVWVRAAPKWWTGDVGSLLVKSWFVKCFHLRLSSDIQRTVLLIINTQTLLFFFYLIIVIVHIWEKRSHSFKEHYEVCLTFSICLFLQLCKLNESWRLWISR